MHFTVDDQINIIAAGPVTRFNNDTLIRVVLILQNRTFIVSTQVLKNDQPDQHESFGVPHMMCDDSDKALHVFAERLLSLKSYPLHKLPDSLNSDQPGPLNLSPKQIAVLIQDGKFVPIARTYDVNYLPRKGDYALIFEPSLECIRQLPQTPLYRNTYDTLKNMVEYGFPDVEWLEACQYDI